MLGRKLFENSDWLLTASLTGRYKVTNKNRGSARKASKQESFHFLRILECMQDLGVKIEPSNSAFEEIAQAFCEACFGNGDYRYQAYFGTPPHEWAESVVSDE